MDLAKEKLEAENSAYKSFDSYFALNTPKESAKTLNVLQIMPKNKGSNTFDMQNDTKLNEYLKALNGYNIVVFTVNEDDLIHKDKDTNLYVLNEYAVNLQDCKDRYKEYNTIFNNNTLVFNIKMLHIYNHKKQTIFNISIYIDYKLIFNTIGFLFL